MAALWMVRCYRSMHINMDTRKGSHFRKTVMILKHSICNLLHSVNIASNWIYLDFHLHLIYFLYSYNVLILSVHTWHQNDD